VTSPIFRNPYFLHLRPQSWPTVAGHVLSGAMMAGGLGVFAPTHLVCALLGAAVWAACLNGGTLAFNSAFDKDEGDIGFLKNPPPPPRRLAMFGIAMMCVGAAVGWWIGRAYFAAYIVCLALSILYSTPPVYLKRRGGWDVVINMTGYGFLTGFAGWVSVAAVPHGLDLLIFLGFAFLFGVVYPMTQFYQMDEDRSKGARTLALVLGPNGTMAFIHVCVILATTCWLVALGARASASPIAWFLAGGCGAMWLAFSADWWKRFKTYPHQRGFYVSMALWAITDLAMIVAFAYASVPLRNYLG
jgi:4-hydroxybenzoate polyprenyltransferase